MATEYSRLPSAANALSLMWHSRNSRATEFVVESVRQECGLGPIVFRYRPVREILLTRTRNYATQIQEDCGYTHCRESILRLFITVRRSSATRCWLVKGLCWLTVEFCFVEGRVNPYSARQYVSDAPQYHLDHGFWSPTLTRTITELLSAYESREDRAFTGALTRIRMYAWACENIF